MVAAVVTSIWVSAAAVLAMVVGIAAARIVYSEVVQTRWAAARDRVAQARSFSADMTRARNEHADLVAVLSSRIRGRDQTIRALGGTVRLAERRAEEAETRVRREARRANEAQERLSAVLDEVAMLDEMLAGHDTGGPEHGPDDEGGPDHERAELPTVVDLLARGGRPGAETANLAREDA
ncbi:MAG: hypothetical protein ACRDQA_29025 [Nocardioidaceae bacterium]